MNRTAIAVEQLCRTEDRYGRFHDVEIEYLMWLGAVKIDYALRLLLPGNEQLQQAKCRAAGLDAGLQQQGWSAVVNECFCRCITICI
ncbi:MAG: hypothetical protein ACLRXQ_01365 [Phascolarctobacterium faecium]